MMRRVCVSTVLGSCEWDEVRAATNFAKHGVDFDEAASIFADPHVVFLAEGSGSYRLVFGGSTPDVSRTRAIGRSCNGRILVVGLGVAFIGNYTAPPTLHVLLVEDDPDINAVLRMVLEQTGAKVTSAYTAFGALKILEHEVPDILVTDIGLPDNDGVTLLEIIRIQHPQLPAIALTGYDSHEESMRELAAGFNGHITKPIQPATLRSVIDSILSPSSRKGPTAMDRIINARPSTFVEALHYAKMLCVKPI